jgi:hypothetical protein
VEKSRFSTQTKTRSPPAQNPEMPHYHRQLLPLTSPIHASFAVGFTLHSAFIIPSPPTQHRKTVQKSPPPNLRADNGTRRVPATLCFGGARGFAARPTLLLLRWVSARGLSRMHRIWLKGTVPFLHTKIGTVPARAGPYCFLPRTIARVRLSPRIRPRPKPLSNISRALGSGTTSGVGTRLPLNQASA